MARRKTEEQTRDQKNQKHEDDDNRKKIFVDSHECFAVT